ncbi:MAG: UDP-N-acetylmuramoyl-L-alanyl-D-glutamate--2,6-diaminopimelate ligase [Candidatus Tenebribacter davisii]|nr:UDP-N-acetylmuramoyl-L-alanyl-D-glutamate--2,6-diaminopimelate ligase [Candidatus Tenebribacter davisii]
MCNNSKMISTTEIISVLKIHDLLIETIKIVSSKTFSGIQTDSRKVKTGQVFVCIVGFISDGHNYAESAVKRGAKLLIVEKELEIEIPQIIVKNTRKATALLAKLFFNEPSKKMKLIGITGTNGKTTIANLIERILLDNGKKVGLIGTLGYSINAKTYRSERTTPDIIDLNSIFYEMNQQDVEFIVMEVSSHALSLDRIFSLDFHSTVFTNLTQDHLDFHTNINEYAKTKFKLFENTKKAYINIDDEHGKRLFRKCSFTKYGISFEQGDIKIGDHDFTITGSSFDVQVKQDTYHINTNLIGKYNIFNTATAFSVALDLLGTSHVQKIIDSIKKIECISGRLQQVANDRNIGIYIDYAHTPDAIKNVLITLNEIKKGRIFLVFGAGGNRDRTKRPKMFEAAQLADKIILTNDNPRYEKSSDIIRDLIRDADDKTSFWIIRDRKRAIQTAVKFAKEKDIVLIAGKGHEKYQNIKGKKYDFDDVIEVKNALSHSLKQDNSLSLPLDLLQLELIYQQNLVIDSNPLIEYISTDSRTIKANSLFFALKGKNFDGHDYVDNILKIENCWAVVDMDYKSNSTKLIRVKDTLEALALLAKVYKQHFDLTTIAVTGSYGKTTVKEYLYNIFSELSNTHKTFGNENNLIGVPRTIFRLDPKYNYSILELGTNQFGEIEKLVNIADPDIGVIVSVGASHLEYLQNEVGVFKEKSALFQHDLLYKFFPADDERFKKFNGSSFGFSPNSIYKFSEFHMQNDTTIFKVNNIEFSIPTPFTKYGFNAGIAVSVALQLNMNVELIKKGLLKPLQISQRMEIIRRKERSLLVDCYNANPDSMEAAIEFWSTYEIEKPHYAILGDMLELGKLTIELHKKILNVLKDKDYRQLLSVGNMSREYNADVHFDDVEELLASKILAKIPENAVILIKASHGIKLEKIIGRI